jgi:hypothetical protein
MIGRFRFEFAESKEIPDLGGWSSVGGVVMEWERDITEYERVSNCNSLPTHSKTPRWIQETSRVGGESTRDGKGDCQLSQGLHGTEHEDTNNAESDDQGGWSTTRESRT